MALLSTTAVLAIALGWSLFAPDPPRPVTRVSVHIPEDEFFHPGRGDFDLSSDGLVMVYRGVGDNGQPLLWVRQWDALDARPIRDTDGATRPKISPDGREVAFTANFTIRVVPIQGGVSRTLTSTGAADVPGWSPDGAWIYFTRVRPPDVLDGLSRIPSAGGAVEIVTEVDTASGDETHVMVDVLPGDRIVYQVLRPGAVSRIQAADLETGEVKDVTPGRYPIYSTTGHLLFQDPVEATLLAAPFDVETLELTGAALPVADGLLLVGLANAGNVAISQTGRLVYRAGSLTGPDLTPVWVERDGTAREIEPGWRVAGGAGSSSLALSPNGTRLALSILNSEGGSDLWAKQLDTGPLSRLTFEGTQNRRATWSPDGQSLTFVSDRAGGGQDVWTKRADGTGSAEMVLARERAIPEALYSRDGKWLVFREGSPNSGLGDIYAMRTGVDGVPAVPLVATEFEEITPALSPDVRWLAYVSNDTGRNEVFVRPFPDTGSGLVQVSTDGGVEPLWAHSGRELFYRNGANELVAVQVRAGPSFGWERQDVLFSTAGYLPGAFHQQYDVSPDDQRFVMLRIEEASDPELILVQNWLEELKQRVPR